MLYEVITYNTQNNEFASFRRTTDYHLQVKFSFLCVCIVILFSINLLSICIQMLSGKCLYENLTSLMEEHRIVFASVRLR